MSEIVITLDPKVIDNAIKRLKSYQKDLKKKCEMLVKRLAEYGATAAKIKFDSAVIDAYDGSTGLMNGYFGKNSAVEVVTSKTAEGYDIVANGEAVVFIEFGSGVLAEHPQADEFGFGPGSWSADHGSGQFAEKGYWFYNKHFLTGQAPAMAMFDTSQELKRKILEIAREVFSE